MNNTINTKGKYDVLDVANYILSHCCEQNKPISNLKLQKILYFIWIDYCKTNNQYLFDDEFSAWRFGPVVSKVYYEFCSYAGTPININKESSLSEVDKQQIAGFLLNYINKSAFDLVEKTHQQNKPWDITFRNNGDKATIPFEEIINSECANS